MNAINVPMRGGRAGAIALLVGGIAVMALAATAWLFFGKIMPASEPARDTIAQLQQLADRLEAADVKGDRDLALQEMDPLSTLLRRLNDTPGIEATPLQNCRLAAAHLAQGVGDVYNGGSWTSKARFKAALAVCA